MAFDLEGARKAGYSDAEIAAHLANSSGFDMAGAKKAGYSDGEVIAHLIDKPMRTGAAAIPTAEEAAGGAYRPPAAAAPRPEPKDQVIGAVEAGIEMLAQVVGSPVGMIGGVLAGEGSQAMAGPTMQRAVAGARRGLEINPLTGPGIATLRALGGGTGEQMTPVGQERTEQLGGLMQNLPPIAGVHGTLAGPAAAGAGGLGLRGNAALAAALAAEGAGGGLRRSIAAVTDAVRRVAPEGQAGSPPPARGPSGRYTIADAISADGPQQESVKLIVREDGTAAIQRDNGDVIDVTNMIRAGFSPERAIAQSLGDDTSGANVSFAAAQQAGQRIAEAVQRGEPAPTPGTLGSVGAAAVDAATQRRAMAAELPVPVQLTKGQATRAQEQLRFETETAKDPRVGAQLRDFAAEQNARLSQNFDAFVDQTGAQATDLIGTGRAVGEAIAKKAARDKVEIRVAYRQAEKAGELAAPVQLEGVAAWLNENVSAEGTTPVIGAARRELVRLGGAEALPDGTLTPRDMTLANAEQFRKFVVQHTDQNPTNIRAASLIKQAVDQSTEGAGGELYSQARALRRRYAQQYEDRALIADLISNRKGTADRRVALEDVFRRSVLQGSREDVGYLRRVLQTGGEEGAQAWREIQGATVRHIRDQALGNVATDIRGNPIVSASKLNSAIKALDADGKLDFIFGKHGAQQMRDLGELSKVIYTAPPGTVNTSNTASVLLAALGEAGAWGGATGLPIPVLTGLKQLSVYVKDRRIQRRIQDALNQAQAQAAKAPRRAPETLH